MTRGKSICKVLTAIAACLIVLTSCYKMDEISETPVQQRTNTKIFEDFELMPSFPGGVKALMAYIKENIRYPDTYCESCVQGIIIVNFVVERDGSITDAKVIKSLDASFDKEVLRIVNSMPKWRPRKYYGKSVRARYNVSIPFPMN